MTDAETAHNAEIVKGLYDAFAAGNVPFVLQAMDPGIEWTEAEGFPYAATYRGPDAVVQNVFLRLRAMEADFAHVWRLRDRKIVRFKQYVDSALVQRAIAR
jgi:ketosteroid isomerase-like protein